MAAKTRSGNKRSTGGGGRKGASSSRRGGGGGGGGSSSTRSTGKRATSTSRGRGTSSGRMTAGSGSSGRSRSAGGGGGSSRGAKTTTNHDEIRRWAEARGGKPSCVLGTGGGGDEGVLRIDFPGYSGEGSLREISWDEWFEKFDQAGLALLYQDTTKGGQKSNFNKLVNRSQGGRSGGKSSGGGGGGGRGRHARAS